MFNWRILRPCNRIIGFISALCAVGAPAQQLTWVQVTDEPPINGRGVILDGAGRVAAMDVIGNSYLRSYDWNALVVGSVTYTGRANWLKAIGDERYIAGTFVTPIIIGGQLYTTGNGQQGVHLGRYNAAAAPLWFKATYALGPSAINVVGISVAPNGTMAVVIYSSSSFVLGQDTMITTTPNSYHLLIHDIDGNLIGQQLIGPLTSAPAFQPSMIFLQFQNDSTLWLTAKLLGNAVIGQDTLACQQCNAANGDLLIAKFDPNGMMDDHIVIQASGGLYGPGMTSYGLAIDGNNGIYVFGWYQHGVVLGLDTLQGLSLQEGIIMKMNDDLTMDWYRTLISLGDDIISGACYDHITNGMVLVSSHGNNAVWGAETLGSGSTTHCSALFLDLDGADQGALLLGLKKGSGNAGFWSTDMLVTDGPIFIAGEPPQGMRLVNGDLTTNVRYLLRLDRNGTVGDSGPLPGAGAALNAWPSPADGPIMLSCAECGPGEWRYEVYTTNGSMVFSGSLPDSGPHRGPIALAPGITGVLVIKLFGNASVATTRVVKY